MKKPSKQSPAQVNRGVIAMCLIASLLAVGLFFWMLAKKPVSGNQGEVVQIAGLEPIRDLVLSMNAEYTYYSKHVAVASQSGRYWHVYRKNIRTGAEVDLTPAATWDCTQPTVSGELIVFRSERIHGLVSTDLEGHNERRLTDFGNGPNFSPDGLALVFTDGEPIADPRHRQQPRSKLYLLKITTGVSWPLAAADAAQPTFSKDGKWVVYWALNMGQRVIETLKLSGGSPIVVAKQFGCVWGPVFTPDGTHILFLSDRGGSTSLWSVGVDKETGRPNSKPEIAAKAATGALSFSLNERALVFTKRPGIQSLQRSSNLQQSSSEFGKELRGPDISDTGQLVAYSGDHHNENIQLYDEQGQLLRQVTDNGGLNRSPRFCPSDNTWITYYSNVSGRYQAYRIRADGSGNERLTRLDADVAYPMYSPDCKFVSFFIAGEGSAIVDLKTRHIVRLPALPEPTSNFVASRWSYDQTKIVGYGLSREGNPSGIWIFDRNARKYTRISSTGSEPVFLKGDVLVAYQEEDSIRIINWLTRQPRSQFRPTGQVHLSGGFAVSPDGKALFFGIESEITEVYFMTFQMALIDSVQPAVPVGDSGVLIIKAAWTQ